MTTASLDLDLVAVTNYRPSARTNKKIETFAYLCLCFAYFDAFFKFNGLHVQSANKTEFEVSIV